MLFTLLLFVFFKMGISNGHAISGTDISECKDIPNTAGASAGAEFYALILKHFRIQLCRSSTRAEPFARHTLSGEPGSGGSSTHTQNPTAATHAAPSTDLDPDIITNTIKGVLHDSERLRNIFTKRLIFVLEGKPYAPKALTTQKRKAARLKAFEKKNFLENLAAPDCLVRAVCAEMVKRKFEVIVPLCEADAQLALLSAKALVDYIVVFSNDSDMLVYPGVTNVIYNPHFSPKSERILSGCLKQRSEVFKKRAVISSDKSLNVNLHLLDDLGYLILCNLLGSDYCDCKGIGIVRALEMIQRYQAGNLLSVRTLCGDHFSSVLEGVKGFLCHPVYDIHCDYNGEQRLVETSFHAALTVGSVRWGEVVDALWSLQQHSTLASSQQPGTHFCCLISHPSPAPTLLSVHMQHVHTLYQHVGCTGCPSLHSVVVSLQRHTILDSIEAKQWKPWSDHHGALPELTLTQIETYITTHACEPVVRKMINDAFQRLSHPTPLKCLFALTQTQLPSLSSFPSNICAISVDVPQSQNRGYHAVKIVFRTHECKVANILEASCDCVIRVKECCRHIVAALLLLSFTSINGCKTSLPADWLRGAGTDTSKAVLVSDCVPLRVPVHSAPSKKGAVGKKKRGSRSIIAPPVDLSGVIAHTNAKLDLQKKRKSIEDEQINKKIAILVFDKTRLAQTLSKIPGSDVLKLSLWHD